MVDYLKMYSVFQKNILQKLSQIHRKHITNTNLTLLAWLKSYFDFTKHIFNLVSQLTI